MKTTKQLKKEAKYAIHAILLKELARKIRKDYPDLRVEAHPDSCINATLFIGRRDRDTSLRFNLRKNFRFQNRNNPDELEYELICVLVLDGRRNKRSRTNWGNRNSIFVNLQEPDSIDRIEQRIYDLMDHLHADAQDKKKCAADNNRPAALGRSGVH